jgi:hypothetical protein
VSATLSAHTQMPSLFCTVPLERQLRAKKRGFTVMSDLRYSEFVPHSGKGLPLVSGTNHGMISPKT